ncbi:MAG TPA: tRNA (guanosine(46)-N7)-methyltransferase TrmB [Gemmataceae bacterium]|nr:tRNA (guanosine(46)-N7)-methyltransferase TrmB [Gemmataceae bacterium]
MRKTKRLPLEELAPYIFEVPLPKPGVDVPATKPIDWRAIFANDHPVEVEVGCGKGLFLITAASACPSVNFFGIEIVRKYQLYTATRLAIRNQHNARIACANAKTFFRDRIREDSLQAVHVYFPDPWWKKRHHKRRLFSAEFAALCASRLWRGGKLHFASDVAEYYEMVRELCRQQPALRELPPPSATEARHDMDYLTNFERKSMRAGREVHRLLFERI